MKPTYHPALIIGAGGTGVRSLRFLRALATGPLRDPELAHMLDCGLLKLLAIDTDAEVNAEKETIPDNLCRIFCEETGYEEPLPDRLPTLPDSDMFYCDPRAVTTMVNQMTHRDTAREEAASVPEGHEHIATWFPTAHQDGSGIPPGQATPAAQLRPLGRLALYLNLQDVFPLLRRAYDQVASISNAKALDVYIVCSLGGATGSGMFWDLAFLLKLINPNIRTTGLFVLAEPFELFNRSGRLYANVYGALKEIHHFKNWVQPFSASYPIDGGKLYQGREHDASALDLVLLHGAYPAGFGVENREQATIDVTCLRLAQNIMALQRRDLRRALPHGLDIDATAQPGSRERAHVFGTTSAAFFSNQPMGNLLPYLTNRLLERIRPRMKEDTAGLSYEDVLERLHLLVSGPGDPALERGEKRPPTAYTWLLGGVDQKPKLVQQLAEQLGRAISDLEQIEDLLGADELFDDFLPAALQECEYAEAGEHLEIEGLDDAYREMAQQLIDELDQSFERDCQQILAGDRRLSPTARQSIKNLAEDRVVRGSAPEPITIPCPASIEEIPDDRFRFFGRNQDEERLDCFIVFLRDLRQALDNLPAARDQEVQPFIQQAWYAHRGRYRQALLNLVEQDERMEQKAAAAGEHLGKLRARIGEDIQPTEGLPTHLEDFFAGINDGNRTGESADWVADRVQEFTDHMQESLPPEQWQAGGGGKQDLRKGLSDLVSANRFAGGQIHRQETAFLDWLISLLPEMDWEGLELSEADEHLDYIRNQAAAAIGYWIGWCRARAVLAAGGRGVDAALARIRPAVFNDGIIENALSRRQLILIPNPTGTSEAIRARIRERLAHSGQRIFGNHPVTLTQATETPLLFYLDLFRGGQEIGQIEKYFSDYERENKRDRTLFHIHRDLAKLPEIISQFRNMTVFCGNAGCSTNIKSLPRSTQFCPGCDQPVLNYCGNTDCSAVNVADLIDAVRSQLRSRGLDDHVPYQCPNCNGELKNYWWRCPHHTKPNPIDKESCKSCVEEYQQGDRVLEDITRRPDRRVQTCHGCETIEEDPRARVQVPPDLVIFYRKGVNGHETRAFLVQTARHDLPSPHLCPNGAREHFLFPTCPVERGDRRHRHHLYETGTGHFCCTRHPEIFFYKCHHCHYPVNEAGPCPRCLNALVKCYFCSDKYGFLYPPLPNDGPGRCPHCTNLMIPTIDPSLQSVEDDLKEPAYCPNIYGCAAGATLWDTACEHGNATCYVCPEPQAKRLPRKRLLEVVNGCPLCSLVLSPVPDGLRRIETTPGLLENRFSNNTPDEHRCDICFCAPDLLLEWMRRDGFLAQEEAVEDQAQTHLPSISFQAALALLQAFHAHRDETHAYHAVTGVVAGLAAKGDPMLPLESLLRIFPEDSRNQRTLHIRIQALLKQHEQQQAHNLHWHAPTKSK